jgi:hypothetical protein
MERPKVRLFCCLTIAALLAGCAANSQSAPGVAQNLPGAIGAGRQIASPIAAGLPAIRSQRSHGVSWMKPNLGHQALLYVGNYDNGTVSVFSYNAGQSPTLVGTLSGFTAPLAACGDSRGNVFIGDAGTSTVSEFAHGATTPTEVLQDSQGSPQGCAVDPTTGNLAVMNWACSCGAGNLAIYPNATGSPKIYANPNQPHPEAGAYDSKGNLILDGMNENTANVFEVAKGSTTFTPLTIKGGTIHFSGQVQWDADGLLIGDQEYEGQAASAVYRVTLSGKTLTIHAAIPLTGTIDVFGFVKRGTGESATLAGADVASGNGFVYAFPSGNRLSSFSGMDGPIGATISQAGS